MAVTKIHPIKSTLKKALDYIENPAKTDEKMLVSSFACSYETADIEFELLLSQAMQKGNNLAHHLIQSFAPGETTPEQAHEIGRQLADGKRLISILSDELTKEFGSNYSGRSLRYYRKFYLCFPDFEIWNTRVPNLNWSHFRALLRVPDEDARVWYMNEAANENWSVRTLDRNIGTQYYYRLLHSPKKEAVIAEMKEKTAAEPKHQFELLKSPIVAEFLGFRTEDSFAESDLESAILSHIRDFLMEMGKGFAFVARQQHIVTDTEDYYIDLVFYNIELKCYVLIDLKMGTITHQDVGQIDMYSA